MTISLDGRNVITDLDFTLRPNEFVCLHSDRPEVATTLARYSVQLEDHDDGEITFCGDSLDSHRTEVSYISYHSQLIQNRTVRQNILLKHRYHPGLDSAPLNDQLNYLLAQLDMLEIKDRLACEISKRRQRQVSIIRAVVGAPELIIVNRPKEFFLHSIDKEMMKFIHDEIDQNQTAVLTFTTTRLLNQQLYDRVVSLQ